MEEVKASLPSYGRDLWDSIQILEDNTQTRVNQMKGLRTLFSAYKKSLDVFS